MNTAVQHTPGPWRVGTPGPNGCYTIGTERGLMTAMIAHSINMAGQKVEAEANACLIAAAPELLAALDAILNGSPLDEFNRDDDGLLDRGTRRLPTARDVERWTAIARAAIAKATGSAA